MWRGWIHPCNSILQGCGSSNSWARALLYSLLQDLHSRFPVQIGQQVDGINHDSHGIFFQAPLHSVEAPCMLAKRVGSSWAGALPEQIDGSSLAPTISSRCDARVSDRPLKVQIRCVMLAFDTTAWQRRSVKIPRKRERTCRERGVHIKIIQNGFKRKHETNRLFRLPNRAARTS